MNKGCDLREEAEQELCFIRFDERNAVKLVVILAGWYNEVDFWTLGPAAM